MSSQLVFGSLRSVSGISAKKFRDRSPKRDIRFPVCLRWIFWAACDRFETAASGLLEEG